MFKRFFKLAITAAILSIVVVIFDASSEKEEILEIDYHYGGNQWINVNLKITSDSIIYKDYRRSGGYLERRLANDNQTWQSLAHTINLATFDTIKSAASRNYIDKPDMGIIVETSLKTHSVLNPMNRRPVEKLLQKIDSILVKVKSIH